MLNIEKLHGETGALFSSESRADGSMKAWMEAASGNGAIRSCGYRYRARVVGERLSVYTCHDL